MQEPGSDLKLSDRLDIIYHLLRTENLSPIMDRLDDRAVVNLQKFVWEKTVEFGIICRGKKFDRRDVTRNMVPTPYYQQQQRCTAPLYNCKGTYCIHSNPKCARKKIKQHVDVMADSIREFIQIVKQQTVI